MDLSRRESFIRLKHELEKHLMNSPATHDLMLFFNDAWRSRLLNPQRQPLLGFTASSIMSIISWFLFRPDTQAHYNALVDKIRMRFRIRHPENLFQRIETSFRDFKISAYSKITSYMSFLIRKKRLSDVLEIYRDHLVPRHFERKNLGEVFTPFALVDMILDRIPADVWTDPASTFLDPSAGMGGFLVLIYQRLMTSLAATIPDDDERQRHIIGNMLYAAEINPINIGWLNKIFGRDLHVYRGDTVAEDRLLAYFGVPDGFRVIVGNPPFEKPQMKDAPKNGGDSLWPMFVYRSLEDWIAPGGFLGMVLPPGWRKPSDDKSRTAGLWDLLTRWNKTLHIHMLSHKDASEMFDNHVSIQIDLVVVKSRKPSRRHRTMVETISGDRMKIRLSEWPYLPNSDLRCWEGILCTDCERVRVMHTTTYHTSSRKDRIRPQRSHIFRHPVVHAIHKDGSLVLVYTDQPLQAGGFGIPKVIFNGLGGWNPPFLDMEGRFGISQSIFAILVSTRQEGEAILRFFDRDTRRLFKTDMTWSTSKPTITWKMFRSFRRDFYRHHPFCPP